MDSSGHFTPLDLRQFCNGHYLPSNTPPLNSVMIFCTAFAALNTLSRGKLFTLEAQTNSCVFCCCKRAGIPGYSTVFEPATAKWRG
jgi:hypothetical protein